MNKAVFLDRDGVINELVYNENRNEYEPPFEKEDLKLIKGVTESLKKLSENKFKLFIVSNQPDFAKGKTSLENLKSVHDELHMLFKAEGIEFTGYYYCFHHPQGIVREYTVECECRKPNPFFVNSAVRKFNLDTGKSWFIGDRDTDILCGKSAGLKTLLVKYSGSEFYRRDSKPDFITVNLEEAVKIILRNEAV